MTRDEIVAGARDAIQQGSKSFRAASRLFDHVTRERAWLLYCWCRHCDDVADGQVFGFGHVAPGKVSTLRDETRRAIAGQPGDAIAYQALALLMTERPIPTRYLEDHLEGFALDEIGWRPTTTDDLTKYCYHVAGAVGCMMAVIMGVPADDEETLGRAADLGIAFQLSNIARDLREDLENGRCYLPTDWLAEFGITPDQLFQPEHEPALLAMVDRLITEVRAREASAHKGAEQLPFRSRLAVLTALRIYGAIGRRVQKLGSHAWDERVSVGKARKLAMLIPSFAEATFGAEAAGAD